TGERPIDRLPKEGLRSIQDLPPYRALVLERRRVARDCFVSYAGSWYSAPAEYAGREVWVRQTEDRLVICDQDRVLAEHPLAEHAYERKVIRAHFERSPCAATKVCSGRLSKPSPGSPGKCRWWSGLKQRSDRCRSMRV